MEKSIAQVCFVLPYFGQFPPWFPGFLLSCEHNPGIHWLILTDIDPLPQDFPENVIFEHLTFQELQDRLVQLIDVPVDFAQPHKLCDVKPLYGALFEERLKDYQYWGHCDLDLIWGDIEGLLKRINYEQYDVISSRQETISGHFTLYKNKPELRDYFREVPNYQKVFITGHYEGFDEGYFAYHLYKNHEKDGLKVYWPRKFGVDWGELDYRPLGWTWSNGKILDSSRTEREYLHFMKWKKELKHCVSISELKQVNAFEINHYGLWTNRISSGLRFILRKEQLIGKINRLVQKFTSRVGNPPQNPSTIPWEYREIK